MFKLVHAQVHGDHETPASASPVPKATGNATGMCCQLGEQREREKDRLPLTTPPSSAPYEVLQFAVDADT